MDVRMFEGETISVCLRRTIHDVLRYVGVSVCVCVCACRQTHLQQVEEVLVGLQFPPLALAQTLDALPVSCSQLLLILLRVHLLTVGHHVLHTHKEEKGRSTS